MGINRAGPFGSSIDFLSILRESLCCICNWWYLPICLNHYRHVLPLFSWLTALELDSQPHRGQRCRGPNLVLLLRFGFFCWHVQEITLCLRVRDTMSNFGYVSEYVRKILIIFTLTFTYVVSHTSTSYRKCTGISEKSFTFTQSFVLELKITVESNILCNVFRQRAGNSPKLFMLTCRWR